MSNFLDKSGLTRFKEKLLDEVDSRISNSSGGDSPTKDEILEGATRVSDVEVNLEVAVLEALQTGLARVESNLESLGNVPSPKAYVTDTWSSGTNWYKKYSDGWIEQGGKFNGSSVSWSYGANFSITLNTAFSNTNYTIVGNALTTKTSGYASSAIVFNQTSTTNAFCRVIQEHSGGSVDVNWYACGY